MEPLSTHNFSFPKSVAVCPKIATSCLPTFFIVQCPVIGCKLKQNADEGCISCATLAGLVLSTVACFILLVIAPLAHKKRL